MPNYRRNACPAPPTSLPSICDRRSNLLTEEIEALREAVRTTRQRRPFHIDAWVVLPDHMHCLWTLPEGDCAFPERWKILKILFSKSMAASEHRSSTMLRRGERGVWQRRYWEHTIRDDRDYGAHMDYIHFNPVKHGLVEDVGQWPYSSFSRCVATRLYPADWLCGAGEPIESGERV